MRKKKIGIFLDILPYAGGTFQYCQTIIEGMAKFPENEYEIIIAYNHPTWEELLKPYAFDKHLVQTSLVDKAFRKAWYWTHLPLSWWRSISKFFLSDIRKLIKLDCHLWIFPSQDISTYQSSGIKVIGVVHDLMHRYESRFPEVSANGEYKRREYLFKGIINHSAATFVDSDYGKQQVIESYGADPARIFPLPYIAPTYILSCEEKCLFEYQLPDKFLFYPAQFWLHKNHLNLIKALAQVKKDIPEIALVLVGSTKNGYQDIKEEVENLGLAANVHFLGYVSNEKIPSLYRKARALVMPTFFGPTNIPPLEAFYLGCPVAISKIYGIPEQVGQAALLFNPNSVEEIAQVIKELWINDELCKQLIANGKAQYNKWNLEHFTHRLKNIVDEVISRS